MKKTIAVLCTIAILFCLTYALAAPGDAYLFSEEQKEELGLENNYSSTMAAADDTLYSLWGDRIYAWKVGNEQPHCVAGNMITGYFSSMADATGLLGDKADKVIRELTSDGTTLYGLNILNGKLFPLTFADGNAVFGEAIQLAWDDMSAELENVGYLDINALIIAGGKLYILTHSSDDYNDMVLMQYDLSTGAQKKCNTNDVKIIAPYVDGKLLVELYDYETAYNEVTQEMVNPTLGVYDPAQDSVTSIGEFSEYNIGGLAYDAQSDTLYYNTGSNLMAMPALGEATQVAYLPLDGASDGVACMLTGGLYALQNWNGTIVRNTDAQYLPTQTLSVYGSYMDDAGVAFSSEYPSIPLTFGQNVYFNTAQEMAQAMASGDNAFDIYSINTSYNDFASLMKKGYCLDLSGNDKISAELAQTYPFIQNALQYNGTYYAVPIRVQSYGMSFNRECWEENELMDKLPTSFMGLIDFINWWTEEGMEDYPDIILCEDAYDYQQFLFQQAIDQYINLYQAQGEQLKLNTPLLLQILQAIEELDFDTLNDTIPQEDENGVITGGEALFATWGNAMDVSTDPYYEPLLISLEEGGDIYIPVDLEAMFINPNSQNVDMAMLYLQTELEKMDDQQHIMMWPNYNEPIENRTYLKAVEEAEKELAEAQEKLKTATPEEKSALQNIIDNNKMTVSYKEKYRWLASEESIAAYREVAKHCFVSVPSIFTNYSATDAANTVDTLVQRYLQKQIPLQQFLSQLDNKVQMMQLEMQ